ncbi:MAG TPA: hypothetical protein VEY96_10610 [Actinomycetes bacterium]|nr:hypothetical protein [Actinomycetes bacterium]
MTSPTPSATTKPQGPISRDCQAAARACATTPSEARRPDARLRATLVGSQLIGLAMARYIIKVEPLASAPPAQVVAAIGPTLQRYLTGDVATPARP